MTAISLTVSKQDFDAAVPAAKEPKGTVFARLENAIGRCLGSLAMVYLGEVGVTAVNGEGEGALAAAVRKAACIRTMLDNMRSLDLVLTGTGFGVVSTNDTAPASKMRVDALEGELRVEWLIARSEMLSLLFGLEGWAAQGIRQCCVQTLFWDYRLLTEYAGLERPNPKIWEQAQRVIMMADAELREKIGDEFMDELLQQECSGSTTDANIPVVHMIRQYIGRWIALDRQSAYIWYRRLMNYLEKNIDSFATYASSDAYATNHLEPYENKQESSAFHFVG